MPVICANTVPVSDVGLYLAECTASTPFDRPAGLQHRPHEMHEIRGADCALREEYMQAIADRFIVAAAVTKPAYDSNQTTSPEAPTSSLQQYSEEAQDLSDTMIQNDLSLRKRDLKLIGEKNRNLKKQPKKEKTKSVKRKPPNNKEESKESRKVLFTSSGEGSENSDTDSDVLSSGSDDNGIPMTLLKGPKKLFCR
ncbi:hypothetical protein JTB14_019280 [Gonioctena quinquepunctata]|nr:hypothetical protein JTB14_019280 [Gonioctena quinquepunctata]